ncbi:MAG: hypothetical protein KBT44_02220 [Bacteroidales bacterium]|nr:hypothetical protein [Candidatus Equibacterium intestinale]
MKNNHIRIIISGIFFITATIFLWAAYPHHLHYQEQFQLFEWTKGYFCSVTSVPGGFADWLGRFFTQFFLVSALGAVITAALLTIMQMLCARAAGARSNVSFALSFIPSIIALIFLLDEKALLGGIVSIILCLLAGLAVRKAGAAWLRAILAIAGAPIMYFLCGPLAVVFVSAACKCCRFYVWIGSAVLLAACPFLLEGMLHTTLRSLLQGVHYYRYPDSFPTMLWAAAIAAAAYTALGHLPRPESTLRPAIVAAVAVFVCGGAATAICADLDQETLFAYDYFTRTGQWKKILELDRKKPADKPFSVCCVNLALAKTGSLGDHLFEHIQGGPSGLFPKFAKSALTPLPASEVFWQLGMVNACQYYTFEANEAIADFQKSGRCYKRLAQTNIVNYDYDVARKYLHALEHTLFYRGWARKALSMLKDETSIDSDPDYSRMRRFRSHGKDEIYNEERIDVLLGYMVDENPENSLAMDYLLSYELLDNNLNNFWYYLQNSKPNHLPRHYQEGVMMLWIDNGMSLQNLPDFISSSNTKRFRAFIHDVQAGLSEDQLKKKYGNTFWFHALYN